MTPKFNLLVCATIGVASRPVGGNRRSLATYFTEAYLLTGGLGTYKAGYPDGLETEDPAVDKLKIH